MKNLTPKQIVRELDKFIIGQKRAKKAVAIALRNRWRRQQVEKSLRDEINPNNIILIGSTGIGKTEISRRLATLVNAPFVKVEASKFTEVGYVGRDVESMIRDLAEVSVKKVKIEREEEVKQQAQVLADDKIMEILFPRTKISPDEKDKITRQEKTQLKFRNKLEQGDYENTIIEIKAKSQPVSPIKIMGSIGMEEMTSNIQDMLSNIVPKKRKTQKLKVHEARDVLIKEESEKLIDMDDVIQNSLKLVEENGIVFIDEIDKIASDQGSNGPDVSREGVQRDILPIIEGCTISTKYGQISTDHILFVCAGAFHVSKPSDLIPELQGRLPIRVEMDNLTKQDFIKILTRPKNAIIKQYQAILGAENVTLNFSKEAIAEIAEIATIVNEKMENIGARRLHTLMTTLLEDILFDTPSRTKKDIEVDKSFVGKKLDNIIEDEDLRRYIL
ncbi:MAG: HslU--HslV peptidase ATPase subunit [Candidatus Marinimicrobia bacterium]|nr:HslU--HslV peptidase ATPase subunit [Candidatus Neomarinimicrobiota bacterium]|tara:strand:- start:1811 stop:3145 length:1335 start_codon:yes stop_codon:yes gene_type:complete